MDMPDIASLISPAVAAFLRKPHKLYIDGEWVAPASKKTLPVVNPATEEPLYEAAAANMWCDGFEPRPVLRGRDGVGFEDGLERFGRLGPIHLDVRAVLGQQLGRGLLGRRRQTLHALGDRVRKNGRSHESPPPALNWPRARTTIDRAVVHAGDPKPPTRNSW